MNIFSPIQARKRWGIRGQAWPDQSPKKTRPNFHLSRKIPLLLTTLCEKYQGRAYKVPKFAGRAWTNEIVDVYSWLVVKDLTSDYYESELQAISSQGQIQTDRTIAPYL